VVSALTAILVLFFVGQIDLISSLVNFGALVGFMLLHVSVVVFYIFKKKSRNYLLHLVVPVLGFLIIGYVLLNAPPPRKSVGLSGSSSAPASSLTTAARGATLPWVFRRRSK
jgi:hypothetical protein